MNKKNFKKIQLNNSQMNKKFIKKFLNFFASQQIRRMDFK